THGKGRYELIKNIKGRDTRINIMSTLSTSEQESQNSYNTDYDYSNNQSHHIRQENQNIDKKSAVLRCSANLGLKCLAYIREMSKNRTILDRLKYKLDGNISLQKNNSQRNSNAQIENPLNPKADDYIDRAYS